MLNNCTVSERLLLEVSYNGTTTYALNDTVFSRSHDAVHTRLPQFHVRRGDITVAKFRGDGLIISTPTGSTAYSLSAGGAVIEPKLACIQYTPICPHTFNSRPIILAADVPLEITIEEIGAYESDNAHFSADGQPRVFFKAGEVVTVVAAARRLRLLRAGGDCFFDTLREKLS